MRDFVYGDDVILSAYKDVGFFPFACAEEVSLKMLSELLVTTTADSGAWEYNIPSGRNSWTATLSGVTVLRDDNDTLWYPWETLLLQLRTVGLNLKMTWTDRKGFEKYAVGYAYIPSSEINGKSGDFSRFSIDFVGSGPLDVNGIIEPVINPMIKRLEWITTGSEPNKVQNNLLIGKTKDDIQSVSREGDDKFFVITAGIPTDRQVLLDNAGGYLVFANNFEPNEYVWSQILN